MLKNTTQCPRIHCTQLKTAARKVFVKRFFFCNSQATDEQIFQYARRLVAAEIQAITFREYLPATLGGTQHIPAYQGYNKSINVGMSNMMSTAAFR